MNMRSRSSGGMPGPSSLDLEADAPGRGRERAHRHVPARGEDLERVQDEVERHLVDLVGIAARRRQLRIERPLDGDLLIAGVTLSRKSAARSRTVASEVGSKTGACGRASSSSPRDHAIEPVHLLDDHARQLAALRVVRRRRIAPASAPSRA